MDFFNRISDARDHIDRVIPPGLSIGQRMDKLLLFTALCGMRANDPLRRQLVSQKNICLDNVMASFLRTDQDASITATLKAANAATALRCFICRLLGHMAKDRRTRPHADAINNLVTQRAGNSSNSTKQKFKFKGGPTKASPATSMSTSMPSASIASESAGVATSFHSSCVGVTDAWLVDSGATSCMSSNHPIFLGLKPDRCAICLANGSVILSSVYKPHVLLYSTLPNYLLSHAPNRSSFDMQKHRRSCCSQE